MRSGVGLALSGGPGGALSIEEAARMLELCERDAATTTKAGASGALLLKSSAAVDSGDCAALQTARRVE
jgi:hypothetical protein